MGIYFHSIFDTASLLLQSGKMTFLIPLIASYQYHVT